MIVARNPIKRSIVEASAIWQGREQAVLTAAPRLQLCFCKKKKVMTEYLVCLMQPVLKRGGGVKDIILRNILIL